MRTNSNERRFSKTTKSSRSNSTGPAKHMEAMEQRRMMSASVANGVLTVIGTEAADRVEIDQDAGSVYVFENNILTKLVPASSVNSIGINTYGGDDYIKIWNGVTSPTTMYAGAGNDSLIGSKNADHLCGGLGNDYVTGLAGNDWVEGGEGNDSVFGGDGNDTVIDYGVGNDFLYGDNGADCITAGAGDDYITAGAGNDTVCGEDGNDRISAGDGNDLVNGGWGHDVINGDAGNDVLHGNDGHDTITGGAGVDAMYGEGGNDYFYAKDGNRETINGGVGYDTAQVDKKPWYNPFATQDSWSQVENAKS